MSLKTLMVEQYADPIKAFETLVQQKAESEGYVANPGSTGMDAALVAVKLEDGTLYITASGREVRSHAAIEAMPKLVDARWKVGLACIVRAA